MEYTRDSNLWNMIEIYKLETTRKICDSNGIWTQNHLVRKRTLNHFSQTDQFWLNVRARSFLTFRQTIESRFTLKLIRDMTITYSLENLIRKKTTRRRNPTDSIHLLRVNVICFEISWSHNNDTTGTCQMSLWYESYSAAWCFS